MGERKPSTMADPDFGINFFGSLSGNMGLGVTARNWLELLFEKGIDVHPVDVPDPDGRSNHDLQYASIVHPMDVEAPYAVNLIAFNPPCLARLMREGHRALQMNGRINILLPFWELPRLPPDWIPTLDQVDIVIASTKFIQESFRSAELGVTIEYIPHPIYLDTNVSRDRTAWGVPPESLFFATSLEVASDPERKNPWAVLEAFQRAFPKDQDTVLTVKLNNAQMLPEFESLLRPLYKQASLDQRVRILDRILPYREVLSFYASADAFISLHRAEGFGLGMMESMWLGTPVIATGWSGNLDYMNPRNACLVDYSLIPVRPAWQVAYSPDRVGPGARWADPDVEEAATWMRRLAEDPKLRRRISRQAKADVRTRQRRIDLKGLRTAVKQISATRGILLS